MTGPHRGAPTPRKPGCCPSRGAVPGSVSVFAGEGRRMLPRGHRWRQRRGAGGGGMPAGRIVFHHLVGLVGGSCAGRADGSGSCSSAAIYGVGKKNGAKKDKKQPCERASRMPPFAAPYAHSCALLRLAGFHPSAGRDLRHCATGLSRALGAGRGWKQGRAMRGGRELPPTPTDTEKEPGAHTEGCARVAGGPCWVSGPAPHSRGLETCPGSGAGLGAAAKILLVLPPRCGTLSSGAEAAVPVPRVLHPPVPGTRSPLVPIPAPNAPCAGQGRPDPQLIRVLRSIFGYQNNPPAPPGFQAMLSLAVQPRADYTAERPRLPAGMLLSVILVIVSRNHRHAAPRDPWRLRRGVPGGGSPAGTPHRTHRLQDGEPRGIFCNTTALGSKITLFLPSQPLGTGDAPSSAP